MECGSDISYQRLINSLNNGRNLSKNAKTVPSAGKVKETVFWDVCDIIIVLFCQPKVEVTSCFVYKVMGLTFHDRINTLLIYRFELAQVVARRITKPQ